MKIIFHVPLHSIIQLLLHGFAISTTISLRVLSTRLGHTVCFSYWSKQNIVGITNICYCCCVFFLDCFILLLFIAPRFYFYVPFFSFVYLFVLVAEILIPTYLSCVQCINLVIIKNLFIFFHIVLLQLLFFFIDFHNTFFLFHHRNKC